MKVVSSGKDKGKIKDDNGNLWSLVTGEFYGAETIILTAEDNSGFVWYVVGIRDGKLVRFDGIGPNIVKETKKNGRIKISRKTY